MAVQLSILCLTPRELLNASRRIRMGILRGYIIDPGPCSSCLSNGKIYRLRFGERAGSVVRTVMFGGLDGRNQCAEDVFKAVKRTEPELTDEEFEGRLKLFTGKGADGVYQYRPSVRRRNRAAHNGNHNYQ